MKHFLRGMLLATLIVSNGVSQNSDFIKVKEHGSISIHERWITFPKSDPPVKAREVKGEFQFNATIDDAIRLLKDEKNISRWQSHVTEFKVYPHTDSSTWVEYSYHDIPWPVSDQDHLLTYNMTRNDGRTVFIVFESVVDNRLAPVRKNVTRMQLSGSWTFEKLGANKVRATYRILSMPLGIPKFLTDPIIRNNMMTTIEEFVALIEKRPVR